MNFFSQKIKQFPEIEEELLYLEQFHNNNLHKKIYNPQRIAHELKLDDHYAERFSSAMNKIGMEIRYAVRPNRHSTLSKDTYLSIDEIPEVLEDVWGKHFQKEDADIVKIYILK